MSHGNITEDITEKSVIKKLEKLNVIGTNGFRIFEDNTNPTFPAKYQNSLHRFSMKSAYSKSVLSPYFLGKNFYIFFMVRICSFVKKRQKSKEFHW